MNDQSIIDRMGAKNQARRERSSRALKRAAQAGLDFIPNTIPTTELADQTRRDDEARLRAVLDTAVDGIITIDERGIIESFNSAAERLFGYTAGNVIGQNISLLMPSPHREAHDRYLQNYRETGERRIIGVGREVLGLRKDGTLFPLELSVSEVQLVGRRIFTGFVRDITARKQAEEALRQSEERFRSLSEASPLGICMADVNGQCTYTNPRWQEMSGLSNEQSLGDGWTSIVDPDDRKDLFEAWNEALRAGREFVWEFRILRPDGAIRWIRARSKSIVDANGKVSGYVGVDEDITARKRDEQRRQLHFETARLLADSGSLAETVPNLLQTLATALDWDVGEFWEVMAKPANLRMIHVWHAPGSKRATFVRHSLKLSIPMFDGLPGRVAASRKPDWIPDVTKWPDFERKREAKRAGLRSALAFPILLHNQTLGVMAFLTHRVTEPDEDLLQMFVSIGSQIAQFMERKRAEAALREANEFGKQVIGGAQTGIIVYDRECRIVVWNPFMERITGCRAKDVLGRHASEAFPFQREQSFQKMFERVLAGEVFDAADIPFDLPENGGHGWTAARLAPWRDAREEIVGVIVAVRDITERRKLESELVEIADREQQRIGHDLHDGLGQRLTALEMQCFLLQQDLVANDSSPRRKMLQEQARQMSQALRECVTATRSLVHGLAPVVLKSGGLTGALEELAHRTRTLGKIECRFVCRKPVIIDVPQTAQHLYRIAQEALNNALKHARAKRILIHLDLQPGTLRLQIKDDGRGLPRRRKAKSSMGLEVMRHRAHVIGATLEIDSKPGQGVSVTCTLPLENHEC